MIALLAACLLGVSTPLVQRFGADVGSFTTAALLYAGAAVVGAMLRRPREREAQVRRADIPRSILMAIFGAGIGPVALAWGLQRTSGTSASLMLMLEAVFTALLARVWYRETLDRRVTLALSLLTRRHAAGARSGRSGSRTGRGVVRGNRRHGRRGVDNSLSRAVAERDPDQVVVVKGSIGAAWIASSSDWPPFRRPRMKEMITVR